MVYYYTYEINKVEKKINKLTETLNKLIDKKSNDQTRSKMHIHTKNFECQHKAKRRQSRRIKEAQE